MPKGVYLGFVWKDIAMKKFARTAIARSVCVTALMVPTIGHADTIVVTVNGNDNPFLAGQPDGASALGDTAPAQSPTLALTNFDTSQAITFSAVGGFNFSGGAPALSADGNGGSGNLNPAQLGLSGAQGIRFNGLVGVFLNDSVPGGTAPAPRNDGRTFSTLSPLLNQIFWIGDGFDGDNPSQPLQGNQQLFFAPTGATRLFLGSTDGVGWFNNSGTSVVTINFTALAGNAVPEPSVWAMLILGFGVIGRTLRQRKRFALRYA